MLTLHEPPSTQSPFAWHQCYWCQGDVTSTTSKGTTPSSSLLRAHAPNHLPPSALRASASYSRWSLQVAVSPCWMVVLPNVSSACLSQDAWVMIPAAHQVHMPVSSLMSSAFPKTVRRLGRLSALFRLKRFLAGKFSRSSPFLPFRPPGLLATQISPTAVALTTGQPWLFHSSRTCVVTFTGIEYASRPNQAIDGRGLSPHKTRSLVGCSTVGFPESGWRSWSHLGCLPMPRELKCSLTSASP